MTFNTYGDKNNPALMLIPGLGVTYEIFLPLIDLLKGDFFIVAVGIDGFLLGEKSEFTSVDDQAGKIVRYVRESLGGHLDMLPLDRVLETGVPFALYRRAAGRMQESMAFRRRKGRPRRIQGHLYQQAGIHPRRRYPFLVRLQRGLRGQTAGKASSNPVRRRPYRSLSKNESRSAPYRPSRRDFTENQGDFSGYRPEIS